MVPLLIVGLSEPLVFQVRNHPNQVVYFNQIVGGPGGAFGRFELDYWGNSILQAVEWSNRLARRSFLPLVVSGTPAHIVRSDTPRYHSVAFAEPESKSHHIEIQLLRRSPGVRARLLQHPAILHVVRTADGAPLCLIVAGPLYERIAATLDLSNDP